MMRPDGSTHEAAHTGHLPDLGDITLCSGVGHHVNRAKGVQVLRQDRSQVVASFLPDLDGVGVALLFSDEAALELRLDLGELLLGLA